MDALVALLHLLYHYLQFAKRDDDHVYFRNDTQQMLTTRGQLGIIVLLNVRPLANVYYSSPYVITISALQCSRKLAVIVCGWSLKGREAWHEACRDNQLA